MLLFSLSLAAPQQQHQPAALAPPTPLNDEPLAVPARIVAWKLKKVSGSSLAGVLYGYAAARNLSHVLDWQAHRESRYEDALLEAAAATHPAGYVEPAEPQVVCTHNAAARNFSVLHDPSALHVLLVREPAAQVVSHYYYSRLPPAEWTAAGGGCGAYDAHVPNATELLQFVERKFLPDYEAILPARFQRMAIAGALPSQLDMTYEELPASYALLERRLRTAVGTIPQDRTCPHPTFGGPARLSAGSPSWGPELAEVLARRLDQTNVPGVYAAASARFRAACDADCACPLRLHQPRAAHAPGCLTPAAPRPAGEGRRGC